MSQPCAIRDCKRASRTLCHCCNQNLCRDHFNKHDDLLNSQLNPLTDEINSLADRLTAINIAEMTKSSRHQLNQWRIDCHQLIDRFYHEKCEELDRCVNESIAQQRKGIADLRLKMTELIERQEATKKDIDSLTSAIRTLERQMTEIERNRVEIDIPPLTIENSSIQIGKPKAHQFDLLQNLSISDTMSTRHNDFALAANDRFLLMHIDQNLCLISEDFSIIRSKKRQIVNEMCWSSVLGCFFAIIKQDVFSINENTLIIERVEQILSGNYWTCGCSNKSLYLAHNTWNSSVFEFDLLPSIRFVKLWKTTDEPQREQRIDAIVHNHGTLALVINDRSIQAKLMELRSSETFSPLWSIRLDVIYNSYIIRCCLLKHNEWLLSDWFTSRLFHITKKGKVKETSAYSSKPYNMSFFGSNTLAIITDGKINFHKL